MVLSIVSFMIKNKSNTRKITLLKKETKNSKESRKINLVFIGGAINLAHQIYQDYIFWQNVT